MSQWRSDAHYHQRQVSATNSTFMSQPAGIIPPDRDAPAPFDDPNADIILRSCDSVRFRTYKLLLSFTSPIFKDMFAIPQPATPDGSSSGDPPVVDLTESAATIQNFLCFCYPTITRRDAPGIQSLSEIVDLLQATLKYDVQWAHQAALQLLAQPQFLNLEPLRVYAIACRFRAENEARLAAKQLLRRPLMHDMYSTDLEMIDAGSLYRVMRYHRQCTQAASEVALELHWIRDGQYAFFGCETIDEADFAVISTAEGGITEVAAHDWFWDFLHGAQDKLANAIDVDAIINPTVVAYTTVSAAQCAECLPYIASHLSNFMRAFRKKIEHEVSKVRCPGELDSSMNLTNSLSRSIWI
jgi:hypothetical protein